MFAWCGGAVLLRSDYLDDVGLFDERFFLYYEDTDLSWRGEDEGLAASVRARRRRAPRARGDDGRGIVDLRVLHRAKSTAHGAEERTAVDGAQIVGDYVGKTYDAARRDVAGAIAQGRRPNAVPGASGDCGRSAGFSRLAASRGKRPSARWCVDVSSYADDVLLSGLTPI